jgi:hypothetical protein
MNASMIDFSTAMDEQFHRGVSYPFEDDSDSDVSSESSDSDSNDDDDDDDNEIDQVNNNNSKSDHNHLPIGASAPSEPPLLEQLDKKKFEPLSETHATLLRIHQKKKKKKGHHLISDHHSAIARMGNRIRSRRRRQIAILRTATARKKAMREAAVAAEAEAATEDNTDNQKELMKNENNNNSNEDSPPFSKILDNSGSVRRVSISSLASEIVSDFQSQETTAAENSYHHGLEIITSPPIDPDAKTMRSSNARSVHGEILPPIPSLPPSLSSQHDITIQPLHAPPLVAMETPIVSNLKKRDSANGNSGPISDESSSSILNASCRSSLHRTRSPSPIVHRLPSRANTPSPKRTARHLQTSSKLQQKASFGHYFPMCKSAPSSPSAEEKPKVRTRRVAFLNLSGHDTSEEASSVTECPINDPHLLPYDSSDESIPNSSCSTSKNNHRTNNSDGPSIDKGISVRELQCLPENSEKEFESQASDESIEGASRVSFETAIPLSHQQKSIDKNELNKTQPAAKNPKLRIEKSSLDSSSKRWSSESLPPLSTEDSMQPSLDNHFSKGNNERRMGTTTSSLSEQTSGETSQERRPAIAKSASLPPSFPHPLRRNLSAGTRDSVSNLHRKGAVAQDKSFSNNDELKTAEVCSSTMNDFSRKSLDAPLAFDGNRSLPTLERYAQYQSEPKRGVHRSISTS